MIEISRKVLGEDVADIKMTYIIIEKNKDEKRSIEQIILSCLDDNNYKRDNNYLYVDENNKIEYNIRHKRNSERYYLEIKSKLRFNKGVYSLSHLDNCLLKSPEKQYIYIIPIFDGVSAAFCEKLYPKYGLFERLLRQLILLVLTKSFGAGWIDKTISEEQQKEMKKIAKGSFGLMNALEQFDLYSMENYLFEKREIDYQTFFNEKLAKNVIEKKEKEELCRLIEEMRPCSLWERNFEMIGKQEKWEKQISEIHDCRNKVAHSKKITKAEYESINKKLNKLNNDLKVAILKLQDKDFENMNYIDILSNFALAIEKLTRIVSMNYDFSKIIEGINKVVQGMVIPLKEAYTLSTTSTIQDSMRTFTKINNTYVNSVKVATTFEYAREINELSKRFSESFNNPYLSKKD